ncbi:hypothetical protein BLD50_00895 [Bacillus cereus]|nr:hypothetical protein BLD50_00895 [Bacillus cereus]
MQMRKNFKKIAPIAVLSATMLCSPASSFAAEQTPAARQSQSMEQAQGIKGYLIQDGVKTPVYKNNVDQTNSDNIPYPELSANPNDPVPDEGKIKTESALPSSILYFSQDDYGNPTYAEKTDDGHIQLGIYDPETLERKPDNTMGVILDEHGLVMSSTQKLMLQYFDTKNGTHQLQDLIDAQYKPYWDGTTLVRETSFKNKDVGIVPKTGVYTFSKAVTSGLTTSDAVGGALTLGYKLKVKGGGGILPAEAEHEFSTQLTASYNHTITVSHQETDTRTLSNQKVADSYPYDKYVGAVYQLSSKYTVNPGPALKNAPLTLAQKQFSYADSVLYLTVTPGVTG